MLRALPFGARNAVFTFGATAKVSEHILVGLFYRVTAQYVDDFPPVRVGGARRWADSLGWQIKKAPKFAEEFTMLEVRMDVGSLEVGIVRVSNKPERGQRISQEGEQIITSRKVCGTAIDSLRAVAQLCTCSVLREVRGSIAPYRRQSAGAAP